MINTVPTIVKSFYGDPAGAPKKHTPVVATLIGPNDAVGGSVDRQVKVYTDENGNWSVPLLPNNIFAVGLKSFYVIRVGPSEEYRVRVPASSTPLFVDTILISDTVPLIRSFFTGNLTIDGDLVVQGSIEASGLLTYTGDVFIQSGLSAGQVPLWYNSIDITGDIDVRGNIYCVGSLQAINYP